jgi:hypothetical protein
VALSHQTGDEVAAYVASGANDYNFHLGTLIWALS